MQPVWLTDTVTLDLDRALHYTLHWGLEGVVLRSVGAIGDRVPHVNEAKLKRRLAEHEVAAAAVDPGLFEHPVEIRSAALNDLSLLTEVALFCKRIGCRRIICGALPGDNEPAARLLNQAGVIAERQGLVLAVRNEVGGRASGREVAALLDAVGHAAVRAAWSPADALESGEEATEGLAALGDRVAVVLVRDGLAHAPAWTPRSLGDGAVGWPDVLRALSEWGYDGPLGLDLRDLTVAKDGLGEATTLIRMIRQSRRA